MGIPWTTIEPLLRNWIKTSSGFPEDKVIFSYQNDPRPQTPYFTLNPRSVMRVGIDEKQWRTDGKMDVTQYRKVIFSLNCWGKEALKSMSKVQDGLERPSIYATFEVECLALMTSEIRDLTFIEADRFKERSQMDIMLHSRNTIIDDVGYFDKVEITGEIEQTVATGTRIFTVGV